MRLNSQVAPLYLPEATQASVMRLGLLPIPFEEWMLVDADLPLFYAHKLAVKPNHSSKVYAQLPQSEAAQEEFQRLLLRQLIDHHGYELQGDQLRNPNAGLEWVIEDQRLWQSSLWVAEDICILELIDESYQLSAASVCSPSNWKLEDKIGRSLDIIHAPVPGYEEQLALRVNKLISSIKPGKPVQRYNWSIQQGNELCWRDDVAPANETNTAMERYWRVERQTLLRLPETQAVVFGIRIFLHSFKEMAEQPGFTETIETVLRKLPTAQKAYKGLS